MDQLSAGAGLASSALYLPSFQSAYPEVRVHVHFLLIASSYSALFSADRSTDPEQKGRGEH